MINNLTEILKEVDSFLGIEEFNKFFDGVVAIVINDYISRMETYIQISEHNIQSLNNERKFIIENLDNLREKL